MLLFIKRWQVVVQIEAAGLLSPQAQQRYVEDLNSPRTMSWSATCRFLIDN